MKSKNSIFLWLLLFFLLTTYNFNSDNEKKINIFKIKSIEIFGLKATHKAEMQSKLDFFKGQSLILFKSKYLKDHLEEFVFIKEFKMKKIYPDTIKVFFYEYKPLAIYLHKNKKFILTDQGKKIDDFKNELTNELPFVFGENADKKFYLFYSYLEKTDFDIKNIKQFNYFKINRWDIILKNDKTVKLPETDYEKSIIKFLEIYEKPNFNKFEVFDFRIKNQLILK